MKTTADIKKLSITNAKLFISNIAGGKTRVSIMENPNAKNCNDGVVLFQQTYRSWQAIPDADYAEILELTNNQFLE